MANVLTIYKGNPSVGATDGIAVSKNGSMLEPIIADGMFVGGSATYKRLKLAIRTDSGTVDNVCLTFVGDNNTSLARWKFFNDNINKVDDQLGFSYQSSYLLLGSIGPTNTTFWIRAAVDPADPIAPDDSVKLAIFTYE